MAESNLTQGESKESLNPSTMAVKESSADYQMQAFREPAHKRQPGNQTVLTAGPGNQTVLTAGPWNQTVLTAGPGNQTVLTSGPGNQTVLTAGPRNQMTAGSGNQTVLTAGPGNQTVLTAGPRKRRRPVFDEEDEPASVVNSPFHTSHSELGLQQPFLPDQPSPPKRPSQSERLFQPYLHSQPLNYVWNALSVQIQASTARPSSQRSVLPRSSHFTKNPVDLGGDPKSHFSIKTSQPKIVRNVVPNVNNPVVQDPPERRV